MYLFILESIGTQELILIGIAALMFLGPRRLPEIAKKIGKITSEFRGTANEFKETWQREVDVESEKKAFDLDAIEAEATTVSRDDSTDEPIETPTAPAIKEIDPAVFDSLREAKENEMISEPIAEPESVTDVIARDVNDKRNWL